MTRALREATALSHGDKRVAVWRTSGDSTEVVALAFNGELYVRAKQPDTTSTDDTIVYEGQQFHPFSRGEIGEGTFTWERIPIGLVGVVFLVGAVVSLWLLRTDRSSSEYFTHGGAALFLGILAFAHLRAAVTGRIPQWLEDLADAGS